MIFEAEEFFFVGGRAVVVGGGCWGGSVVCVFLVLSWANLVSSGKLFNWFERGPHGTETKSYGTHSDPKVWAESVLKTTLSPFHLDLLGPEGDSLQPKRNDVSN